MPSASNHQRDVETEVISKGDGVRIRFGRYRKTISWSVIGAALVALLGWGGSLARDKAAEIVGAAAAVRVHVDTLEAKRLAVEHERAALHDELDRARDARIAAGEVQSAVAAATLEAIRAQLTEIQTEGRASTQRIDARLAEVQVVLMRGNR